MENVDILQAVVLGKWKQWMWEAIENIETILISDDI